MRSIRAKFEIQSRINAIVSRAHQRSALNYRSFLSLDTYILILAFKTYVKPLLDYVSPVWSPTHVMLIRSVEAVQRKFTKKLLGMHQFAYTERLTQLGLQSLNSYGFLKTENRLYVTKTLLINFRMLNSTSPPKEYCTMSSIMSSYLQ